MIRKLAVLTVFSVSALFFTTVILADQAGIPDRALPQAEPINKHLIALIVTKQQGTFEQGMAEAGWDIRKPQNLAFYNVRQMIARNDIQSLENEINKKIASRVRSSRALNSSA